MSRSSRAASHSDVSATFPTSALGPAPTPLRKLKPGVAGYWVGGALMVLGIVGAVVWFVLGLIGISNSVDDFERVPADGGGTITLDAETEYVVYVEDRTSSRFGPTVRVALTDPSGASIDLDRYGSEFTYDFSGRAGTALFTFRSTEAGDYELAAESSSSLADVAVGRSLASDLVWTIAMPFVIGGIGVLAGAILLIVTIVRRSGDKKRRTAESQPSAPYSGFPGAPPGMPGPPPAAPPPR